MRNSTEPILNVESTLSTTHFDKLLSVFTVQSPQLWRDLYSPYQGSATFFTSPSDINNSMKSRAAHIGFLAVTRLIISWMGTGWWRDLSINFDIGLHKTIATAGTCFDLIWKSRTLVQKFLNLYRNSLECGNCASLPFMNWPSFWNMIEENS